MTHKLLIEIHCDADNSHVSVLGSTHNLKIQQQLRDTLEAFFPESLQEWLDDYAAHGAADRDGDELAECRKGVH